MPLPCSPNQGVLGMLLTAPVAAVPSSVYDGGENEEPAGEGCRASIVRLRTVLTAPVLMMAPMADAKACHHC